LFVDFFIRRPIFATVCSLLIILAGVIAIPNLAVEEYPQITPPQVVVTSNYIGASAQTVESSVTIPLEQQINGVPGMKYMTSASGNDGTSTITVTFDLERNVDLAAVDVQIVLRGRMDVCRRKSTRLVSLSLKAAAPS
jgi:HAE1 family hydrophobic/amphiphilic exporter-1